MKRPSISLDKEAIVAALLRHGEKPLAVVVGLVALGLAWSGISALRGQAATAAQSPRALTDSAAQTAGHIERQKSAPDTEKRVGPPLTTVVEQWLRPEVAAAPSLALLDRPLFAELPKRGQPAVFPIEDLVAVAGLAVLPSRQPAAPNPAGPDRVRPRERDPDAARGVPGAADPAAAGDGQPRPRLTPYVIVTGKIPVARQKTEYRRRFEGVGHQDSKRDQPLWSDWKIERAVVGPGEPQWVELTAAESVQPPAGGGPTAADVPTDFLLPDDASRRSAKTPPYCGPLPQRAKGSWGQAGLHPWVVQRIQERKARANQPTGGRAADGDAFPGGAANPGRPAPPAPPPVAESGPEEFAMFRFIDTDVEPGRAYRYRVRFEVWNPNFKLEPELLENAALAAAAKLASPPSNESAAVAVPDSTSILIGLLSKDEMKRLKGGLELLVLAPSKTTGDHALRGIVTEPGGFVNVDGRLNKPGDRRSRGEDIATNRLVVDVRGRQEERTDLKPGRPPEPFEVLCLRPDGGFELVSAADSATAIADHAATLPSPDGGAADPKPGPADPPVSPFGKPF